MAIRTQLFKSKVKHVGIFGFKELYEFCYNWVMTEIEPANFDEKVYSEKVIGDGKNIDIEWEFEKILGPYFKYEVKLIFKTIMMKDVEINRDGKKIKTNNGEIGVEVTGTLVHDYANKFEDGAWKAWRTIYEKWIIPGRIEALEGKTISDLDEILIQTKAFLDLEGIR